jgi:glycosyltransferase involved in cell wall biosynthesis
VLHLIHTLGRGGGAERNLVNVLRALPRGEHAVCYLSPPEDYAQELREAGIPVRCLGMHRPADFPRVLLSLCNEILRGEFQLLCTQIWLSDLIGRIAGTLTGVPVVSIIQTSAYHPAALAVFSRRGRVKMRLFQSIDSITSRLLLRRIVAVSDFVSLESLKRLRVSAERVAVIPNSVDPAQFNPCSAREREQSRAALGLSPRDQAMLFVGKLSKGKGTDLLFAAMPTVLMQEPNAKLLVLGTGPEAVNLRNYAQCLGISNAVRFLGQQSDVRRYLGAADFFVFASHYEGLPLAVLEAMACGLPCLLSDIPPHREIADEGRGALLVQKQPQAWARAMLSMLLDHEFAQRLARHGQRRCAEVYHVKVVARAFEELFQAEVAAGARPGRLAGADRKGRPEAWHFPPAIEIAQAGALVGHSISWQAGGQKAQQATARRAF